MDHPALRTAQIVAGVVATLTACDADVSTRALDDSGMREPVLATERRARRRLFEWGLEPIQGDLRFVAQSLDDPPPDERADCVPLADGDVLAIVARRDGFSNVACFFQLHPTVTGWQVVELGTTYQWCVDAGWAQHSTGTVTVDARSPRELACRIDVVGENADGAPCYPLNAEVWVDPQSDSQKLRSYLERFRGVPALR